MWFSNWCSGSFLRYQRMPWESRERKCQKIENNYVWNAVSFSWRHIVCSFVSLDVYPARSILHSRQLPSSLTNASTECVFVCVFYVTLCCVCLYVREWLDPSLLAWMLQSSNHSPRSLIRREGTKYKSGSEQAALRSRDSRKAYLTSQHSEALSGSFRFTSVSLLEVLFFLTQ